MKTFSFIRLFGYSFILFSVYSIQAEGQNPVPLKLQYDFPATNWESEALPLGNGFMGAMVFGDVPVDVIQLNEHSLWSGGPGKNPAYNGGHRLTAAQNRTNLQNARNALQGNMSDFSALQPAYRDENGRVITRNYPDAAQTRTYINALKGTKTDFGSYQSLGNILIAYNSVVIPEIIRIEGDCDNPGGGEKFPMLFDGSPNTKWYADTGFKGFPCYIAWEYETPFPVSAYTLISGNDTPARDPKAWNLYGSTNGSDYSLIDSRTDVTFSGRNQSLSFTLPQNVTFKYFKLEITATFTANTPPQLSEISLENAGTSSFPEYTDYHRELDIDRAVSTITYSQNGVNYTREYFVSHPGRVMLIRLRADQPGSLSRNIRINSPQTSRNIRAEEGVITMEGKPADHRDNGLKFALQIRVIPSGGSMTAANDRITVENADEILIISSAATNYQQCMDESYNYFSPENPLTQVQEVIRTAAQKSWQQLIEEHTVDYRSLYERMALQLGNAGNANHKTVSRLLDGYRNGSNTPDENRYLEALYYQFGRYLLIASSRKTGLPANLQGIWAEGLAPPWSADYHTNINIQMNYWLAEQTNLADCHLPAIDFVKSLVPRGRYTAQHYFCKQDGSPVRGWVDFHENNIWGNTGPAESDAFYFPAAAGWLCQDIWEYYLFNQDKAFLEEYYPVLLEAALFWVDNLWRDTRDGTLVATPSYSPEHGPYSLGTSCDQAIITELFDMTLKASRILNRNTAETEEIAAAKEKLAGPQIGLAGQFMEWKDEIPTDISGDGGHRHVNHLFWLHPGSQIIPGRSPQEDLYAEAMKNTLNTRGDGGTGWSKAWKINFWARLRDGNRSHRLLGELLKESTLTNLFDTHPPFQIDGNFGATAGMTEMLLQSQGNAIEILPALPDTWAEGNFRGIKARGNFEITARWESSNLVSMEIISHSGNTCTVKYPGINRFTVHDRNGETIVPERIDENTFHFETTAGNSYTLEN